jgi:hypothetical protein
MLDEELIGLTKGSESVSFIQFHPFTLPVPADELLPLPPIKGKVPLFQKYVLDMSPPRFKSRMKPASVWPSCRNHVFSWRLNSWRPPLPWAQLDTNSPVTSPQSWRIRFT